MAPQPIDIDAKHLVMVWRALIGALPGGARVWAFGSRARGGARRYSDLDLAVDVGRRLTRAEALSLRTGFEDSDLPFAVDVIDWYAVSPRFREAIDADRVPLPPVADGGLSA